MATPGLALIGFMPKDVAIRYLAADCEPANRDPAALEAEWNSAVSAIAPALSNAGVPAIRDIPAAHQSYITQLRQAPDWQHIFLMNQHWDFKLVEAAPLLAYQFSVLDGTATSHAMGFSSPPTLEELLNCCLPLTQTSENYNYQQQQGSVLIQAKSLNVRPVHFGETSPGLFTLQIGVSLPFVHVVRFQGKCFLHNGYHRTYAALTAGATEVPCIIRDVQTEAEIGLGPGTFDMATLTSANPPTLHHLANGYAVDLVVKTRTIHLSWTDWVTPPA